MSHRGMIHQMTIYQFSSPLMGEGEDGGEQDESSPIFTLACKGGKKFM